MSDSANNVSLLDTIHRTVLDWIDVGVWLGVSGNYGAQVVRAGRNGEINALGVASALVLVMIACGLLVHLRPIDRLAQLAYARVGWTYPSTPGEAYERPDDPYECPECNGTGMLEDDDGPFQCPFCAGDGRVEPRPTTESTA